MRNFKLTKLILVGLPLMITSQVYASSVDVAGLNAGISNAQQVEAVEQFNLVSVTGRYNQLKEAGGTVAWSSGTIVVPPA